MTKKKVRGLLDLVSVLEGEDWEWEHPPYSEEYMPGIGFGASKQATRWAYIGYLTELKGEIAAIKKKAGRKQLGEYKGIDCRRALALWKYVQFSYPPEARNKLINRQLINDFQNLEKNDSNPSKLFSSMVESLEQSISRGRSKLNIDQYWNSDVCEKLTRNLS